MRSLRIQHPVSNTAYFQPSFSMDRHDPLSELSPASAEATVAEAPPPKPKGGPKLPPLLKALACVHDDTLAFLYGGPNQGPGDYERNKARVHELRSSFTAFCETNPHYANWRQAWTAFIAQPESKDECNHETVAFLKSISPHGVVAPVQAPVRPLSMPAEPTWRMRMRRIAIYG